MELYNEILRAALALPFDQRWKLVEEIDETLHPPPRYKTKDEFEAALRERIEEVESGRVELVDADIVLREIREKIDRMKDKMLFD